jgi:hypothetical protein
MCEILINYIQNVKYYLRFSKKETRTLINIIVFKKQVEVPQCLSIKISKRVDALSHEKS